MAVAEPSPNLPSVAVPRSRIGEVVTAAREAGVFVTLLGDSGNGKAYLAERAAEEIAADEPATSVHVLSRAPHPGDGLMSVFSAETMTSGAGGDTWGGSPVDTQLALQVLERDLRGRYPERSVLLVALNVDEYAPHDLSLLDALARSRRYRIIATARKLTSALERIGLSTQVRRISVAPLELDEAASFLASLLGVDSIDSGTLRRWYDASRGNGYALAVIALAADRNGELKRSRGTAWVASRDELITGDYAEMLASSCTAEEWRALEFIAQAEPVVETVLLRTIDAAVLTALFERGMVLSRPRGGSSSLETGHSLLGASIRAGMSPIRRIELNDRLYELLSDDPGMPDPRFDIERLTRIVVFGVAADRQVPFEWLWSAFEAMVHGGDPRLMLRLAQVIAFRSEANGLQAGSAALHALRLSRLLGEDASRMRIVDRVTEILAVDELVEQMPGTLAVSLHSTLLRERVHDGADADAALAELEALRDAYPTWQATEMIDATRVHLLAHTGRLRDAAEVLPPEQISHDLRTEWVRAPSRALAALILEQQGALDEAVQSTSHSRTLNQLGPRARGDMVDLQGFAWLMGFWTSGSRESAHRVYEGLVNEAATDVHGESQYSGLVETCGVLLSVQEGRWSEAVLAAEQQLNRFAQSDPYGLAPLLQAALALALAVLGERDTAIRAIVASEYPGPGLAMVLSGHRRILALRARHWLRDPTTADEAVRLAEWAAKEQLPFTELLSRHLHAVETGSVSASGLERAHELAGHIDDDLASAFIAHLVRIGRGVTGRPSESDEPEIRLLANLGVWIPITPGPNLTQREREIVLLAGLGHTSRFIAERLTISPRTVETHLSNAFRKIGVENRDELQEWMLRNRASMHSDKR
ncbi:LuxR C-terminal-related transcriptional regulator [Leucobacter musarum]|uniref:LuxR C-terminal-related transcriptional regulator n=1 Tax=Leucobacter musarum TaxID=1930747 RepID=UPI0006A77E48|nr:LuxR C-terminal-related transcriptional regulator [Leucobacter musarum]